MNADDAVIVALGSNQALGAASPQQILESALTRFPAFGLEVVKRSRWWRSKAWPDPSGPAFVNGVVLVRTALGAEDVLQGLHAIEAEFGRERAQPNAPRTLDLDLVAYGREVRDGADAATPPPRGGRGRGGGVDELAPGQAEEAAPAHSSQSKAGAPARGRGASLPHPLAHERLFVMGPLAEIAPEWRHPVSGRSAASLAKSATVGVDAQPVRRPLSARWKLALLAAATAALIFALLAPLQSVSVKLTLPPSNAGPPVTHDLTPPQWEIWAIQGAIVVVVLLAAAWFAARLLRRRR